MKASVLAVYGELAGRRFPIGDAPVTFGRGDDNDIIIPDPAVSRHHAQLRQEADGFVLADLGSANGTQVNGEVITTRHLRPGDEITIAKKSYKISYELQAGRKALEELEDEDILSVPLLEKAGLEKPKKPQEQGKKRSFDPAEFLLGDEED